MREPAVVEEVGFRWVERNRLRKILNRTFVIPLPVIGDPAVVVRKRIVRLEVDRSGIVVDSELIRHQLIVREGSVEESFEVIW